jgi:putative transposase
LGLSKSELKELALAVYESAEVKPPKRLLSRAFSLSRSGLYLESKQVLKDNSLRKDIEEIYEFDDVLGCRKLAALLGTSKNRVFRVMLKYGISPRRKRAVYKYPGKAHDLVGNRLLQAQDLANYTILFSDIFQFRLEDKSWVYCCFVIRKKTRQILSFCYGYSMQADLVSKSIQRLDLVQDLSKSEVIFHSDQGTQYGARITLDMLAEMQFERSMSRAGTPTDNGMAERFVQTFKLSVTERYKYRNLLEFEDYATKWLNFYNNHRPHHSLKQKSPNQYAIEHQIETIPYLYLNFV